jgi:hypothetical protein
MTFSIGPEHAAAQIAATVVFADSAVTPSIVRLYSAADGLGDLLAEITMAKPSGTIAGGILTLHPASAGGSTVLLTGIPRSGKWLNGDGLLVALGTVTDLDNGGDFRIAGSATAVGETSPTLYAGGMVLLGTLTFN